MGSGRVRGGWLRFRPEYWLVIGLSVAAVALLAWRVDVYTAGNPRFAEPGWDRHAYRELARRDLLDFKLAPYCWRVLVPWLAKLQPWSLQTGFLSITVVALVATGPALYGLLRASGSTRVVAIGMVLAFYSLGWAARYPLADFWVPDSTGMLFTIVAMWLIVAKRWWAACAVLAAGVLAKESVVFAGSLAFSWHLRGWRDWQTANRGVLVIAPALLVLVGVRLLIQPENGNDAYLATMPPQISRFPELFEKYDYRQRYTDIVVNDRWAHRQWGDFDQYLLDPFGLPVLGLAAAGAVVNPKRAARLGPFVILVYSQLLFATDTQRLLVLALPALAMLGAESIAALARRQPRADVAIAVGFAGVFVVTLVEPNEFGTQLWREAGAFVAASIAAATVDQFIRRRLLDQERSRDGL